VIKPTGQLANIYTVLQSLVGVKWGVKKSRKQIKRREKGYGGEGKGRNRGHPTPVILLEKNFGSALF